jgi:hypothetical protein
VGAEREVEDEVALGLARIDAHMAQLQGLQEHRVGELALVRDAEDLLEVLFLDGVAVEAEILLRTGAFLLQLFGDHLADLVHKLRQVTQAVVHLVHGRLIEVVVRIDVQIQLQALAAQFMLGGDAVVPAVIELNLSEVFARYLGGHIFNIDPKSGAFQHRRLFI